MSNHTEYAPIIPCQPPADKKFRNLNGLRFGRLIVRELAGKRIKNSGTAYYLWNCLCDCGEKSCARTCDLTNGYIKSCGCLKKELASERFTTHGLGRLPEYVVWANMIQRCENRSLAGWHNYGGRGIKVCDRWFDFALFYADMGPRPTPKHTIERINNNAGYSPDNCCWATRMVQSNNTRNTKLITFDGKTMNIYQWGIHLGISPEIIRGRIGQGWSFERAISQPVGKRTSPASIK